MEEEETYIYFQGYEQIQSEQSGIEPCDQKRKD